MAFAPVCLEKRGHGGIKANYGDEMQERKKQSSGKDIAPLILSLRAILMFFSIFARNKKKTKTKYGNMCVVHVIVIHS